MTDSPLQDPLLSAPLGDIDHGLGDHVMTERPAVPLLLDEVEIDDDEASSFAATFFKTKGPPQIALLMLAIAIGGGCTVGVVPAVMSERFGNDEAAQNAAATSSLVSNCLTFFTSPIIGSLSDEYGRRPFIISGVFLSSLAPIALLLIQMFPNISPWVYYASNASTGMINWVAIALSSLADVLPPAWRAAGAGLLLSGLLLGFAVSPLLSLTLTHVQLSFVSALVVLSGLFLTIFYLPETLAPEVAIEARERRRDTSSSASLLTRPFRDMAILNRDGFFRILSTLAFFSGMVMSGDQTLLIYYAEEKVGFTDADISIMIFLMGIMGLFAQAVLLKPMNECLGEKRVVAMAFAAGAIDNILYGIAPNKYFIFAGIVISSLCGMAFPTISAMKANNVDVSEQGRVQGALYSLQALASGVGPVLLRFVGSITRNIGYGGGNMFLFASCLYLVAVVCAAMLPVEQSDTIVGKQDRRNTVLAESNDSDTETGDLLSQRTTSDMLLSEAS